MIQNKLRLLVAYPYLKKDLIQYILEHESEIQFLLDSGAFTAWKAGKQISVDDYCKFIESLPFKPWRYFALDVVGNPKATMQNYETMLARGFKPVPIFTRGEDISVLDDYYKTSDVVGVGGLVGTPQNKGFVKGLMTKINGRKVHLLGFTAIDFLKYYKPYMADSSSWMSGARYASINLYLGNGKPFVQINKKKISTQLKNNDIYDSIRSYGIDPLCLLKTEYWAGNNSAAFYIGARSARSFSDDCFNKLGVNLFLACSAVFNIKMLLGESENEKISYSIRWNGFNNCTSKRVT